MSGKTPGLFSRVGAIIREAWEGAPAVMALFFVLFTAVLFSIGGLAYFEGMVAGYEKAIEMGCGE